MTSLSAFPVELYPLVAQHLSSEDLKSYALVNAFCQRQAQPLLFSSIRIFGNEDERMAFFGSPRGSQLIKHATSLTLGDAFWEVQDNDLISSVFRSLENSQVDTLHLSDIATWEQIPENIVSGLYTVLPTMSRLHALIITDVWNIPFIEVVSRCQFLRSIQLDAFSSVVEDPDDEIDANTLPNIQSFTIVLRGDTDLAPYSSIGRFFEEKGSSIESLSLGTYRWEDMPFTMDLVPGVKRTLRQLTLVWPITQHLGDQYPLQLNEFPQLETLHFAISLNTVPWTLFLQYLYQQFEQARFHSSLKDVYIEVVAESARSLSLDDSETTSNMGRLAICSQVSLHVTLHIERYSVEDGIVMKSEIHVEEYDSLQRAMESSLWWWVGAGQLVVTRQYEPLW